MEEIKHDGTSEGLTLLRPGLEWEDIEKALMNRSTAFVRVRAVRMPKGYKLKKKRKRKAAREARKRNR